MLTNAELMAALEANADEIGGLERDNERLRQRLASIRGLVEEFGDPAPDPKDLEAAAFKRGMLEAAATCDRMGTYRGSEIAGVLRRNAGEA